MIVNVQSKASVFIPQFFIVLMISGCVSMYDPSEQRPDLIIESVKADRFEGDGRVLALILYVENRGRAWVRQTEVAVLEPQYHWARKRKLVPALNPKERRAIELRLEIPKEAWLIPDFLLKVDPDGLIDEIDERNNELRVRIIRRPGFHISCMSLPPEEFPEFPWPPPRASTMANLPNEFFNIPEVEIVHLHDVDDRISDALDFAGYVEKSYYAAPDGFAIVSRLEQINPDGTPKSGSGRWAVEVEPLRKFSLSAYLRALFTSEPGYFRIIVFIVTPHPFSQSDVHVSRDDAIEWLFHGGLNRLPSIVGEQPYSEEYACTALIYEFEKQHGEEASDTVIPGRLSAQTHLEKSTIINGFRRQ